MNITDLHPPASYSPWWLIIALALTLLVVAWVILLPILAKRRALKLSGPQPAPQPLAAGQTDPLRQEYLARIDALSRRRAAQEISDRTLHLELSTTLREYVKIRIGLRADTMTLTDLQADPVTRGVAGVIERCYHPAFAQGSAGPFAQEPIERAITVQEAMNVVNSI